jgi:hypothetical protein
MLPKDHPRVTSRLSLWLRNGQVAFYLAFLCLWFKGSVHFLRNVRIAPALPLALLAAVTLLRFFIRLREKTSAVGPIRPRRWATPILLVLVATVIRIPLFFWLPGLFHSDDAVALLISKHIAEGRLPPIYHYGQDYLGTLPHHLYALVFQFSGPSVLALAIAYFLFYLGFIVIQYYLFKEIGASPKVSALLALFYCLPIGELLGASFSFGVHIAIYLFLGSLCLYLSLRVYKYDKKNTLPVIGFLLGLAFWTHPIVLTYGLCSAILIAWRYRAQIKRYLTLMAFFLVGFFPTILSEIDNNFGTVRFLFSGQNDSARLVDRIRVVFQEILHLLTPGINLWSWLFLAFLGLGMLAILATCLHKKKVHPEIIFVAFFLLCPVIYIFSKFSSPELAGTRYLYPLYCAIPYLLYAFTRFLPSPFRPASLAVLLGLITLFPNAQETARNYREVKRSKENVQKILAAIDHTQKKYWAGEFWEVILLTGLSKEKIIGWSYSHEDYPPYRLQYFNAGQNNNFLFFKNIHGAHDLKLKDFGEVFYAHLSRTYEEAEGFIRLLRVLGIPARTQHLENGLLIYDISADVFPQAITSPLAGPVPAIVLSAVQESGEFVLLTFTLKVAPRQQGFRLGAEIPGYSSSVQDLSPGQRQVQVVLPFPAEASFVIRHGLDYVGMRIPATQKENFYSPLRPGRAASPGQVIHLAGFGPQVNMAGRPLIVATRKTEYKFERPAGQKGRLIWRIYSPFRFSDSTWYGTYEQRLDILVNNQFLKSEILQDGSNLLVLNIDHPLFQDGPNIITLVAKYQLPFGFAPLWKTSYLLEGAEFEP